MPDNPNNWTATGVLMGVVAIPFAWLFAWLTSHSKKLDKAHQRTSDHELHVEAHFVKKNDFDKFETRLFNTLKDIQETLHK